MALKNQQNDDEGLNDINITPFVDVVLVLLVIFMVTAPAMVKQSLNVKLPKSNTTDGGKSVSQGIAITKEGQIFLNGNLVSADSFPQKLIELKNQNPEITFLISADAESMHGKLIEVIDTLKKNGLNQFALQVEKLKSNSP
jgi:biopolymer transport protein ExbD